RLRAVTEDRARVTGEELGREDGDHAGLAERVLAGAVDVGEGERRELQAMELAVDAEVVQHRLLGRSVRGQRTLGMGLPDRQLFGLAIDRAAAAGEHDLPRPTQPGPL